jgi:hypothetical protein
VSSPARTLRYLLLTVCGGVAIGVVLIATLGGAHRNDTHGIEVRPAAGPPLAPAGTPAAFRYLTAQRSNQCGLTPGQLEASPPAGHLQGSCCFPMDLRTYGWQVTALRRYSAIPQIPRDPYDVPVALARSLLRYDSAIHLSARQQATYDRAMSMSSEKGPCCCHCWRWSAFKGLSTYLIARRNWTASAVALIIDDLQGCGGKSSPPNLPSHTPA